MLAPVCLMVGLSVLRNFFDNFRGVFGSTSFIYHVEWEVEWIVE